MPNKLFYGLLSFSILVLLAPIIYVIHSSRPGMFSGLWNTLRNAVVRLYTYVQQQWAQRRSQGQQNNNVVNAPNAQPVNPSTQPAAAVASSQQTSNAGSTATNQTLPRDGIELQRRPNTDQISEPLPFEPPIRNALVHHPHQLDRISETEVSEELGKSSTVDLDIEEWRGF